MNRWGMAAAVLGSCVMFAGGSCQDELRQRVENEPDLGAAPPSLAPRFVSPGVARDVHTPDGMAWHLDVRNDLASVTNSVDLWISQGNGPAVFAGAMPSCYGRDPWRVDPKQPKDRISTCYLGLFNVINGNAVFKVYLAGGWVHTIQLPVAAALRDTDGDGWNDPLEVLLGTRPDNPDTDGDGREDPSDDNPLAAPLPVTALPKVEDPRVVASRQVVALAVANTPPCYKDKPLMIIGPRVAHQSLPHRTCTQIYVDDDTPLAVQRGMLLPVDGKLPSGDTVVAETAIAGGLPRVKVEIKSLFAKEAEVHVINMAGKTIKKMEKVDNAWRVESQEVVMATP